MTAPAWLTAVQAAEHAARHVVTVRRALESGELHGHQARRGGPWRLRPAAVDAWITGTDGRHACGCSAVSPLRRRIA
ncbi:helix-turn-helix domain-containing protein [Saccharopolyspora sp. 6V]|uniref:helix-turn-helix domain-containing protein n=1 Tax=Saccharopolyspora sp. 6V TaxID=2877239 RepID=UPI001CD634D0|nr:helix-turn-helix domain-containing protein [Saccharopolyspora sp. 6V]MCA1195103.1 helix-turn-helix domain-containing protein [Saccharopolyspora sp. 6V]